MSKHTCAVVLCGKTALDGVSLHLVNESDPTWRTFLNFANNQFLHAMKPLKRTYVCSDHFQASCFSNKSIERRRILPGHNPSVLRNQHSHSMKCNTCQPAEPEEPQEMEIEQADPNTLIAELNDQIAILQATVTNFQTRVDTLQHEKRVLSQRLVRTQDSKKRTFEEMQNLSQVITKSKKFKAKCKEMSTQTDMECLTESNLLQFFNELQRRRKNRGAYSSLLQEFSLKLHYLSPKAYLFVREYFEKLLPETSTFARWTKHINTKPGFFPSSMQYLKSTNIDSKKIYNLILDEIHTRKKITWDGHEMHGYEDYGDILELMPDEDSPARTALFMMLTEVNGTKSIPIGYMLCAKLDADMISKAIKGCLVKLGKEITVIGVTFDGLSSNMAASELLGANLDPTSPSFKTHFSHPITNAPVYVMLDPSHMMKLLRNQLKDCQKFIDGDGNEVKWDYIHQLILLQSEQGLRAANKLTIRHDKFEGQKMKTRLATQSVSNSTAVAMEVCERLGLPQFEGCKPTAQFLKTMDKCFDIGNSQCKGKGYKRPLTMANRPFWRSVMDECYRALFTLKYVDKRTKEEKRIITSKKGTFAVGLIVTMASIDGIMLEYLEKRNLTSFLPTYKLSQDFLEMFFAKIRSRLGCNDNPSPFELLHLLKYVLSVSLGASCKSNCSPQDQTEVAVSSISSVRAIVDEYNQESWNDVDYMPSYLQMSMFVANVVVYISGYVCKELCSNITCPTCILAVLPTPEECLNPDYALIIAKDNGGLCKPSRDVVTICKITESVIRASKELGIKHLRSKNIVSKVFMECSEKSLFKSVVHESKLDFCHTHELIKRIINCYCKIRLHYIAKEARIIPNYKSQCMYKVYSFWWKLSC